MSIEMTPATLAPSPRTTPTVSSAFQMLTPGELVSLRRDMSTAADALSRKVKAWMAARAQAAGNMPLAADGGWREDDHPRDKNGKFKTGAAQGGGRVPEPPHAREGEGAQPAAKAVGGGAGRLPQGEGAASATGHAGHQDGAPRLTRLNDVVDAAERRRLKEQWFATQPARALDELYSGILAQRQAELNAAGADIAAATGAELKNPGFKKRDTAEEKMARKGYPSSARLTDLVRNGYVVDQPEQADEVVRHLARHFDVLDEGWSRAESGYFDRKVGVKMMDGTIGEVQIWPRELYAAKKADGHKLYTEERSLSDADPRKRDLVRQQQSLYSAVLSAEWANLSKSIGSGGITQSSNIARSAASLGSGDPESRISEELKRVQPSPDARTAQPPSRPGTQDVMAGRSSQSKNATSRIGKSSEGNIGAPEVDDNEK